MIYAIAIILIILIMGYYFKDKLFTKLDLIIENQCKTLKLLEELKKPEEQQRQEIYDKLEKLISDVKSTIS